MERLTMKRNGKNVIPLLNAVCGTDMPYWRIDRADDLHNYLSGDAADRLAAYEDTGLEPREVKAKCAWADKMCKTLSDIFGDSGVFDFSHFKELLKTEQDGRLVVLPCKVGDTVYEPTNRGTISTYLVHGFRIEPFDSIWLECDIQTGFVYRNINEVNADAIGKTVFLTREEAEAALEKEATE